MNAPAELPALGMVLKGYPRISETFISNEILLLERAGFSISLLPMRHPRESFTHASVKEIQAPIHYLPTHLWRCLPVLAWHNLLLAARSPRRYARALGLAWQRFRRTRKSATIKHLLQAGYLTRAVLEKNPQIRHLHAHFAHSPTSVTLFASLLSGLPFSFTAHAKDIYTSDPAQLREKIELASFVVTCTRYNKRFLAKLAQGTDTPIHCVYHGIDVNLFSKGRAKQETSAPTPPYSILTVARITEKKGLPTIYRALDILRQRGTAFTHTLIGDGDDRPAITALIRELGLQEHCAILGTRTHDEVLRCFTESDIFVLGCEIAANGDRDGIPNVLVESLAMEVPSISTTVSAIPEIIEHEKTGLTVPPGDPHAMADAMERLLTDQPLRQKVRRAGREKVLREFDNTIHIKRLAEIYREALGRQ